MVYPDFAFNPEQGGGPAATLIVEAGKVYWQGRSGQVDCLDSRNGKVIWECVVALDKQTGKEVWKALDDSKSSSSPLIVVAGGKRQLIVWTANAVTSLNPATGETYWRETMVTSNNDSIPTPVVQKNRLLISGLMFELNADAPTARVLWPDTMAPSKRLLSNTSSPMLQGDYVYSAKSSGELQAEFWRLCCTGWCAA